MKKIPIIFCRIILIAILFIGCNRSDKSTNKSNFEIPTAPDIMLVDLMGDTLRLSDYKGKIIILDIWDTWCPPCRKGIPDFIDLYEKYKDQNLVIIGLALGREGKEKVENFAKEYGIQYPLAIADAIVLKAYSPIKGIPTTFIINQKGKIHNRFIGFREKEVFENEIQALIDE